MRVQHAFFGVLQRQKPGQMALPIRHQQLFNPPLLHQGYRLRPVNRLAQQRQIVRTHHHRNRCLVVRGKPHVPVGHDAHDAVLIVDHRKAGDRIALHQFLGVRQSLIRPQSDRRIDDAAFEPLHPAHLARLRLKVEVAVDHPDPAGLRHGDRHAPFRHRVHRGRQQGNVHPHQFGDIGGRVRIRRQHGTGSRHQQHIIKGQSLANLHENLHWGQGSYSFGGSPLHQSQRGARVKAQDLGGRHARTAEKIVRTATLAARRMAGAEPFGNTVRAHPPDLAPPCVLRQVSPA